MLRPTQIPVSIHPVEIVSKISATIDSGKDIDLNDLRCNLSVLFKDVTQTELMLYEDKIDNPKMMKKMYKDIFLMLRECNQESVTVETFNLFTGKYGLEKFVMTDKEEDITRTTVLEEKYNLFDVIVLILGTTLFIGVALYIGLNYLIPILLPGLDPIWIPYTVAIICFLATCIQVTGYFAKDIKKIKDYKEQIREMDRGGE